MVKDPPTSVVDARDTGLILGLQRSPGGGNGNPLQYSCLENPKDRGAWRATVQGVLKSQTRLSDWAHTMCQARVQSCCCCSICLPGEFHGQRLQSMGLQGVGRDCLYVNPSLQFIPPHPLIPWYSHKFVFYIYDSTSAL